MIVVHRLACRPRKRLEISNYYSNLSISSRWSSVIHSWKTAARRDIEFDEEMEETEAFIVILYHKIHAN